MSEEIKEYPFDVKFDESALKTFNDLIKEKGIRHFKLESDLYGILDVVSYEEYEKLQQKVEQLEKENEYLKMSNPEQNMEHFRIVNENKRKIDMLRKENHQLENIRKEAIEWIDEHDYYSGSSDIYYFSDFTPSNDLLNILNKGDNNE